MINFPPPPPPPEWGTHIPSRYGYNNNFKMHRNIGHAKSAILNACELSGTGAPKDMQLLHWNGQVWEVVYQVPAGTTAQGLPWRKSK